MHGYPASVCQKAPPPGVSWQSHPGGWLQLRILHESALLSPMVTGVRWIEHTGMVPRFRTANPIRMIGGSMLTVLQSV